MSHYKVRKSFAIALISVFLLSGFITVLPQEAQAATTLSCQVIGRTHDTIFIQWSETEDLLFLRYEVYSKLSSGSYSSTPYFETSSSNYLSKDVKGYYSGTSLVSFSPQTSYECTVWDFDNIPSSAQSNPVTATTTAVPTLSATIVNGDVSLSWTNPYSYEGSVGGDGIGFIFINYAIYRDSALIYTIDDKNTLTYDDDGAPDDQTVTYQVHINSEYHQGSQGTYFLPYTMEDSVLTPTYPSAPTNLEATSGDRKVTLDWDAPFDGRSDIDYYVVYVDNVEYGDNPTSTSATIDGLTNGESYSFKVRAHNAVGLGPESSTVTATPFTVPGAPTGLTATPGDTQVELDWDAPSSNGGSVIDYYIVYRNNVDVGHPTTTSFTDTGLVNGEEYSYQVAAHNDGGEGPRSSTDTATPFGPPGAPRNLEATSGDSQIILAWEAPSNDGGRSITGYNIYRGTSPGGEASTPLASTSSATLTYTDDGVTNGQVYYYLVRAVNEEGPGDPSNEASATPATVPDAPSLTSTKAGSGYIVLQWTAPSDNGGAPITKYRVYRGTAPGEESLLAEIGNVLTYNSTGLTNGQTYYYKVSAVNSAGEGELSNELGAMPITVPSAPTLDTAAPGNGQVTLAWSAPSNNGGSTVLSYNIYRGTSPGAELLIANAGNTLSYIDTNVTNGVTYYYKVSAVNIMGVGAASNERGARPVGPPTAPSNLQASPGDAHIYLTWQEPSSNGGSAITNYGVWRGTYSGGESFLADAGTNLWYNDTGLVNGVAYYYFVRAENAVGVGPQSGEVWDIPRQAATVPAAPQGLTATPGNGQVTLDWSVPISNGGAAITGYKVYRGTSSGATTILTTLDNVLTYTDTTVTNDNDYYYQVSALNSVGEGPKSSQAATRPGSVPSAPRGLQAVPGDSMVSLTWTTPAYLGPGTLTYHLFRNGTEVWSGVQMQYTDRGVSNNVPYSYKIAAQNAIGWGPNSTAVPATPVPGMTEPSAPLNLVASGGIGQIALTWQVPASDGGSAITGYRVYRGTSPGGENSTPIASTNSATLSYTDTGLSAGTYYYVVRAVNANGFGEASNEASAAATAQQMPSAPQNLEAVGHDQYVLLTWQAPSSPGSSPIIRYDIYRSAIAGDIGTLLNSVGSSRTSYNDSQVTNNVAYYYTVKAVNAIGSGDPSNQASAMPSEQGVPPGAPLALEATSQEGSIRLTWSAPENAGSGVEQYQIFRSEVSGGQGDDPLASVSGGRLSYVDASVIVGIQYYYIVRANNSYGVSLPSNEASSSANEIIVSIPSAPQSFAATNGIGKVTLTWKAPADDGGSFITGYKVFRKVGNENATLLQTVGASTLSYEDTTATAGTTYTYYVVAMNAAGEGVSSIESTAKRDDTLLHVAIDLLAVGGIAALAYFVVMKRKKKPSGP